MRKPYISLGVNTHNVSIIEVTHAVSISGLVSEALKRRVGSDPTLSDLTTMIYGVFSEGVYVPGSKLPLFPYNRG